MNRYDHQFAAKCPTDGATIIYHLTIKTHRVIMAEELAAFCQPTDPVYHEAMADQLFDAFGGRQKLRAMHHGVHITTTRRAPPPEVTPV